MRLEPTAETRAKLAGMFKPTMKKAKAIGFFLVQQVRERFRTHGQSGGVVWPEKRRKAWGADDGRAIMTGTGTHLQDSFHQTAEVQPGKMEITVQTDVPWAKMHEYGTIGASPPGTLPTIKPVKAKALFIPISNRAMVTERHEGAKAAHIRNVYGKAKLEGPMRVATRGKKLEGGEFAELKAGKLENGRLMKRGRKSKKFPKGEWVPGTPDFIFLTKSDIPPRPMLPKSPREQEAQAEHIREIMP